MKTVIQIKRISQKACCQWIANVGTGRVQRLSVSGIRGFPVWGHERKNNQHKT
jgi:hypothetical protein